MSLADIESLKSRRLGGSGEGARGPRGRREEVEFERPFLLEDESPVGVGVVRRECGGEFEPNETGSVSE